MRAKVLGTLAAGAEVMAAKLGEPREVAREAAEVEQGFAMVLQG